MEPVHENEAGAKDEPPQKQRIARDLGVRVRIYPTPEQAEKLGRMMAVRHGVWNLACERFERERAQMRKAKEDGSEPGPRIETDALKAELRALRLMPGREGMRILTLWSTLRALDDAWKARQRAFEGHARWPQRRGWRRGGPGTVAVAYDGRNADRHYLPNKVLHLSGVGRLSVRTGAGHMPRHIAGRPTVTITRDAAARWWASLAVPANGVGARASKRVTGDGPGASAGVDVGVPVLATLSDGTAVRSIRDERALERNARHERTRQRVRENEKANGISSRAIPLRAERRRAKQRWTREAYAAGGTIADKRAEAKAREAARRETAKRHRAESLRSKAKTAAQAEASPTRQRARHKGKGSGAGRRRRTAHRTHDEKRLRRAQRKLSRRERHSKGRERARLALAKQHARIADHARDCVEQLTSALVRLYAVLHIETLIVRELARGWCGKAILDARVALFLNRLEEKAPRTGALVVRAAENFPSSKRCHRCGAVNDALKLGQRTWTCGACETRLDREDNAAANLYLDGLRRAVEDGSMDEEEAAQAALAIRHARKGQPSTRGPAKPAPQVMHKRTRRCRGTEAPRGARTPVERNERRGAGNRPARRTAPGSRKEFGTSPHGPWMEQGP